MIAAENMEANQHHPALMEVMRTDVEQLVDMKTGEVMEVLSGELIDYVPLTEEPPIVKAFWEVIHSMDVSQQKKFLFFVTGCNRAPVGGLGRLGFTIQRSGADTEYLPTSHTCFNILLLPDYSSKEKLETKLAIAIANGEGFGLQ